jgi:hypothetical protein
MAVFIAVLFSVLLGCSKLPNKNRRVGNLTDSGALSTHTHRIVIRSFSFHTDYIPSNLKEENCYVSGIVRDEKRTNDNSMSMGQTCP